MKKKIILLSSLVIAAGLVLWLALKTLQPKEVDRDVVGICYRDGANEEDAVWRTALEQELRNRGFSVEIQIAGGDQAVQMQQLQEMKNRSCDVLLIQPVLADEVPGICSWLEESGIPAVLIEKERAVPLIAEYPNVHYVGYEETGVVTGHLEILNQLPEGGDINGDGSVSCLVLSGPENYYEGMTYGNYLESVMPDRLYILSAKDADSTQESGRTVCKQELANYGKDIEVILCSQDVLAIGAHQAVVNGGRTVGKDVYLLGAGGDPEALTMIREGNMTATMEKDPETYQKILCDTLEALIRKHPVEPVQRIPYLPRKTQ